MVSPGPVVVGDTTLVDAGIRSVVAGVSSMVQLSLVDRFGNTVDSPAALVARVTLQPTAAGGHNITATWDAAAAAARYTATVVGEYALRVDVQMLPDAPQWMHVPPPAGYQTTRVVPGAANPARAMVLWRFEPSPPNSSVLYLDTPERDDYLVRGVELARLTRLVAHAGLQKPYPTGVGAHLAVAVRLPPVAGRVTYVNKYQQRPLSMTRMMAFIFPRRCAWCRTTGSGTR